VSSNSATNSLFARTKGPAGRRPPTRKALVHAEYLGYVAIEDDILKLTYSRALESMLFREKVKEVHELLKTRIRIEFDATLPWPAQFRLDQKRIALRAGPCIETPLYIGSVVFEYCNAGNFQFFERANAMLHRIPVLEFALDSNVQGAIAREFALIYELIEIKTCKHAVAILFQGCQHAGWKIRDKSSYNVGDVQEHLRNMQRSGHTSAYKRRVLEILMAKEKKLKEGGDGAERQSNAQIQRAKKAYIAQPGAGAWAAEFTEFQAELRLD